MRPALSVVFLTTLIGAGQGLFLATFAVEVAGAGSASFFAFAAAASVALAAAGLAASFFHLGRPERAWRSAAMWRTSWLSREVIALPVFMGLVALYGYAHHSGSKPTLAIGAVTLAACVTLFYCTAMIYACIRFLQEWASPFTIANFFLMGCASGTTLAAALAAWTAPAIARPLAFAAVAATAIAYGVRLASLARNARIRPRSTLQSAIGVRDPVVRQVSQGFTAGAFTTREFFHGVKGPAMRRIRLAFPQVAFVLPIVLLAAAIASGSAVVLAGAFVVQYAGLVIERWFFLAQASHPQNLYYQNIA